MECVGFGCAFAVPTLIATFYASWGKGMTACGAVLRELLDAIEAGRLLPPEAFAADVSEILRLRESPEFEAGLIPRFDEVSGLLRDKPEKEREYIGDFVEEVFVHVFTATESDDLSAYVADDFGLLAEALHVNYEDEWLNGMVNTYAEGRIPCGPIAPLEGRLLVQVRKLAKP